MSLAAPKLIRVGKDDEKGRGMIRKLSAILVMGAVLAWVQAIPAGAVPLATQDSAADGLLGNAALIQDDQTFESSDGDGIDEVVARMIASEEAEKKCKKIKNKKKRKKCLKKAQEPEPTVREVEFEYVCPCTGSLQLGTLTGGDPNLGGGAIPVTAEDLYLAGVAEDSSGTAISVGVSQDDGTGANESVGGFCGETEEPIQLNPGAEIRIFVGSPSACPGSVALGGTITFTLSDMPIEAAPEEEAPE